MSPKVSAPSRDARDLSFGRLLACPDWRRRVSCAATVPVPKESTASPPSEKFAVQSPLAHPFVSETYGDSNSSDGQLFEHSGTPLVSNVSGEYVSRRVPIHALRRASQRANDG